MLGFVQCIFTRLLFFFFFFFLLQEASLSDGHSDNITLSALDEDDFQTMIIENKLGCDLYFRRTEQNFDKMELLQHDKCASLWLPPPRYSDRLNIADESREPRRYVSVQIVEAKVGCYKH